MENFLIQLDQQHEAAQLPTGEGFPPTGFIAGWRARVAYEVGWLRTNLNTEYQDLQADLPSELEGHDVDAIMSFTSARESSTGKFSYTFDDYEAAQAACKFFDAAEPRDFDNRPDRVWLFQANNDDLLGMDDEAREKFGETLTYSVSIRTMRSKKYRHEYHFIVLPAFVAAYAKAMGLNVPEFDLSPLLKPEDEIIFSDETQDALIGGPNYRDSHFWQERTKIWEALGEPDATKYHTIEAGTKASTSSDRLDGILQATVRPWVKPVYARLIPVPDPRVGAAYTSPTTGEKVRPNIPVITEIFPNRETAEAAAVAERERFESGEEKTTAGPADPAAPVGEVASTDNGMPPVPPAWAEFPDSWTEQIQSIKSEKIGKTPRPAWDAKVKSLMDPESDDYLGYDVQAEPADVIAWLEVID